MYAFKTQSQRSRTYTRQLRKCRRLSPRRIQQQHAASCATVSASDRQIELIASHTWKRVRAVRQIDRQSRQQRSIIDIERVEKLVADRRRCIRRTHAASPVSTILHPVAATRRRRARCGADISPSAIPASSARVCRVSNMLCGIAIDGTAGWTRYQPALALRLSTRVPRNSCTCPVAQQQTPQYALNSDRSVPSGKIKFAGIHLHGGNARSVYFLVAVDSGRLRFSSIPSRYRYVAPSRIPARGVFTSGAAE